MKKVKCFCKRCIFHYFSYPQTRKVVGLFSTLFSHERSNIERQVMKFIHLISPLIFEELLFSVKRKNYMYKAEKLRGPLVHSRMRDILVMLHFNKFISQMDQFRTRKLTSEAIISDMDTRLKFRFCMYVLQIILPNTTLDRCATLNFFKKWVLPYRCDR